MLGAFRVRSFRFQWSADLLTSWASEMETVVLGWYVITQTGSVVLLTVFGSLQFFGTLAAPVFGVLSDRVGINADTPLDVSTNGQVIVVSPVRDRRRTTKLKRIVAEAHSRYGGVFRRLAE